MRSLLAALAATFILSSCSHHYYVPATQNVPLLREKNEFRGTVAIGTGDETSTVDVQAAYAVTDKFAVIGNFMSAKGGDESAGNWGRGSYGDLGFGYYKAFEGYYVFDCFVGLGLANQQHAYNRQETNTGGTSVTVSNGSSELRYARWFLQPSIGLTFNAFDVAFTPAFSYVNFTKVNNNMLVSNEDYLDLDAIAAHRNSVLFEPAFTIRGGWKYVKVQAQYSAASNLSNPDLNFLKSKASIGLSFAIAPRYKLKK